MQLNINTKSIGVKFNNGLNICFQSITYGISIYIESPNPWLSPDRVFLRFFMIPDDLEFWNHAFWVIPNPELIQRFIPPGLGIYENSKGEYFVMEHIPF